MLTLAYWNKLFFGALTLLIFGSLLGCDLTSSKTLSKPIVQVDKYTLNAQDFSRELAKNLKNLDALSAKDEKILAFFKQQIISDFIVDSFVSLWFDEKALSLSPAEIEAAAKSAISTYPSDSAFREALSEQGLSYSDWIEKLKKQLKKKRLISTLLANSTAPTEQELLSYYNNNRSNFEQKEAVLLHHILVADQNQGDVVRNLLKKQSFSDVAKKYSSAYSPETKDYYGWIERDFSPDLEKAFKLRQGDLLGPILLSDGLHIFKVIERRPFKIKSFAEVKKQVDTEVLSLREKSKFSSWLDVQIKKYQVKKKHFYVRFYLGRNPIT